MMIAMDEIKTKTQRLLDVIINSHALDHQFICAVADVNRYCKKLIGDGVKHRKSLLPDCPADKPFSKLMHRYGSALCWAFQITDLDGTKALRMIYCELGKEFLASTYSDFLSELPHKPTLFFNEEQKLCFYGYGLMKIKRNQDPSCCETLETILCYCLPGERKPCIAQASEDLQLPINCLLSYPKILEPLLSVQPTNTLIANAVYSKRCLSYSLNRIVIPDNYEERSEFICEGMNPGLIHLPMDENLKNLIEARYAATRDQGKL